MRIGMSAMAYICAPVRMFKYTSCSTAFCPANVAGGRLWKHCFPVSQCMQITTERLSQCMQITTERSSEARESAIGLNRLFTCGARATLDLWPQ